MVENPKNVGTYYAKLTDSAAKKLRNDNPTLSKDPGIVGTYTIAQGKASAELRGYDSKAADAGFNAVAKRYEDLGYVVENHKDWIMISQFNLKLLKQTNRRRITFMAKHTFIKSRLRQHVY
ncbi:MBG domain-containing protein [Lactobacillus amylolyticus]|uniref:MBG domain-containing protein n=1 Tax=Lactobacillus amylolyticus TaxID=83683 RepID=UPI0013DE85B4|nr:MBG domain-containing protein [Lactobacillus amylolyticus]